MKENESFMEVEVWDGDEYFSSAAGPRDYVIREVMHYASLLHAQGAEDVRFMEMVRTPVTLEGLKGEVHEG